MERHSNSGIPKKIAGDRIRVKDIAKNKRGKEATETPSPRNAPLRKDGRFGAKLTEKQKRLWELEKFLLRMLAFVIPVYLILAFGADMSPVQKEVARESYALMNSMGFNVTLYNTGVIAEFAGKPEGPPSVASPGRPPFFFTISPDCTGWKAMLFFAALVLAVPRRAWKLRVAGIVAGVAVLWLVNIFRVAAVVSVYASHGLDAAMLVHDWLWQIGMGATGLLLWLAWLRVSRKGGQPDRPVYGDTARQLYNQ